MNVNIMAVLVAAVAMFVVGAIWYMPIFGRAWGRVNGLDFEPMSKKEQAAARKAMGPQMVLQFVMTLVSAWVLAKLMTLLPDQSPYTLAGYVWLGFIVPAQVSAVIFGNSKRGFMTQKIAIMAGEALLRLEVGALIISTLQE